MPRLDYSVTGPSAGTVVGRSITVSGVAQVLPAVSGNLLEITVSSVQVEFGAGGPVLDAPVTSGVWSCTGSLLPSVRGGTQVTLTAVLRGTHGFSGPGSPNDVVREEPFEEPRSVSVQVARAMSSSRPTKLVSGLRMAGRRSLARAAACPGSAGSPAGAATGAAGSPPPRRMPR